MSKFTNLTASLLLGYIGAWLFMHIHLPPETLKIHEPGFILILNGQGPAPDQYRLLQNHLIGLLFRFLNLYLAVMLFTGISLAISIYLILEVTYRKIEQKYRISLVVILTLIYPVLMFNGPRGDSAFILLLSILITYFLDLGKKPLYIALIICMSFTRADVALFAVLFSFLFNRDLYRTSTWIGILAIPILIQCVLKYTIFPAATYYVDVVMLNENAKLATLIRTPALVFLVALFLLYFEQSMSFLKWIWYKYPNGKAMCAVFVLYLIVLYTVALIGEMRLFLPLLPFTLLLVQKYRQIKFNEFQ